MHARDIGLLPVVFYRLVQNLGTLDVFDSLGRLG